MPAIHKGRPHPHLRAVPNTYEQTMALVFDRLAEDPANPRRALRWVHLKNGLDLIEREAKHHLGVAEEVGNETVAASLENVLGELSKAKEALR